MCTRPHQEPERNQSIKHLSVVSAKFMRTLWTCDVGAHGGQVLQVDGRLRKGRKYYWPTHLYMTVQVV